MPGASSGLHVVVHPAGRHPGATGDTAGAATGAGDALRVVLVHGSLDRGTTFSRVVRRLPDLEVVTYDRRGYGRSRHVAPPPRGLEDHVVDLVDLVGTRPTVAVGHSFGGDVAIGAALRSPWVVAVGAYEPPMPWLEWWPRRPQGEAPEDPGAFAEGFFKRMVGDEAWDRLPERGRVERRADGPALVNELTSLRLGGAPFDATALTVPCAFGRGGRSRPHHRHVVELLADTVPGARLVEIPGAGHGAHASHPDEFAALVRDLVERAAASPGARR